MYASLKSLLHKILPQKSLFKHELFLRSFYAMFFIGNNYQCNICLKKLRSFKKVGEDKLCPSCGSLPRNRRLWDILNKSYLKDSMTVLDFSPSRNLYRVLKKKNIIYTASDLSGHFISDVKYDITNISSADNCYDLIICYHILEHVINDIKAMDELLRVLKPNGTCIIQTPFKDGGIYEDYSITNDDQRKIHFGQEDHVRWYSVQGLKDRLEKTGFEVNTLVFSEAQTNFNGFDEEETILVCNKPSNA
ncbi:class I SAM-dependent methyltransferase [Labilibacter sediminis]|nr:class I SAM-dependent methyltransferase [Labilibacter sediminis]